MGLGTPPPASMLTAQAPASVHSLTPPEAAAVTAQAPGGSPDRDVVRGVVAMGQSIDKALLALAQAAPLGAMDFDMARDLIKRGLAAFISQYGEAESAAPEAAGNQFPSSTVGQGY